MLTLLSPSEQDLGDLIAEPAAFERRHGLRIEPGACPPAAIFERALSGMRSAPQWASLLCTRLYVLGGERVVGSGGVKYPPDESAEVEIGYGVAPAFHGRGLGTQAARAIVDDAFARGVRSVIANTLPGNVASWRLLQRLAFERIADLDDPQDGLLWCWRRRPD